MLQVLEARSLGSRPQHGHMMVRALSSWFRAGEFLLCPHLVEGARDPSGALSQGINPIKKGSNLII